MGLHLSPGLQVGGVLGPGERPDVRTPFTLRLPDLVASQNLGAQLLHAVELMTHSSGLWGS